MVRAAVAPRQFPLLFICPLTKSGSIEASTSETQLAVIIMASRRLPARDITWPRKYSTYLEMTTSIPGVREKAREDLSVNNFGRTSIHQGSANQGSTLLDSTPA